MPNCPLTLRTVKGSKLTFNELDSNFLSLQNCINVVENNLNNLVNNTLNNRWHVPAGTTVTVNDGFQSFVYGDVYVEGLIELLGDSQLVVLNGDIILSGGTVSGTGVTYIIDVPEYDSYVTGGTYNSITKNIDFTGNLGFPSFSVDLSTIPTNDITVVSGVYDNTTGTATFTNNTGGTFTVTGFLTGYTNYYTTGATLNGNTIEFGRTDLTNAYSVNLSPALSAYTTTNVNLNGNILEFDRADLLNVYSVDLTPALNSVIFTGNTSASCISDIHVSNLHGCSPITIHNGLQSIGSSINDAFSIAFGNNAIASGSEVVNIPIPITVVSACTFTSSDPNYASPAIILNGDVTLEWFDYVYVSGITFSVSGSSGTEILNNGGSIIDIYYDGVSSTYIVDPALTGSGYTLVSGGTVYFIPTLFQRPSFAFGDGVTASGIYSHAFGENVTASGKYSHAEGENVTASGNYSHAEGYQTMASGAYSHAEGYQTMASGNYSYAEGFVTIASGDNSHAEGAGTIASGFGSHAEGSNTKATGSTSHVEGVNTLAAGNGSHAEGASTKAYGYTSHAEGGGTIASGDGSHAEGTATLASGNYSHSEGYFTKSDGYASHAEGFFTIASGSYQHASGMYNLTGSTPGAFILGNGTDDLNRSNLIFAAGNEVNIYGKTITTTLQITSGATNGYVLTSDASGNATWQVTTDTNFANTDLTFTGNRNHDTNGNDLYIYNGLGLDGFGPNINSISIGDPRISLGYGYYLNNVSLDIGVYNGNTGFTFTTQGVERMRMNNSGNLGIGTTSPSEKLDVSGKTKTTNFQMTSGATNGYVLTSDANGNATWADPNSGYVEYRALLTQTGTTAPTDSILGVNTLTGGTWTYGSVGSYFFTKVGAFSATTKVEVSINPTIVYGYIMSNAGFNLISATVYSADAIEVRTSYWGVYPDGVSQAFVTPGANGTSASDAMSDNVLNNTPFCVKVWS